MVGRLQGSVDGRPILLIAQGQSLTLRCEGAFAAVKLRKSGQTLFRLFEPFIRRSGLRLLVQVGWLGSIEIYPNPLFGFGFIVGRPTLNTK